MYLVSDPKQIAPQAISILNEGPLTFGYAASLSFNKHLQFAAWGDDFKFHNEHTPEAE
jgi:hypothetical protein